MRQSGRSIFNKLVLVLLVALSRANKYVIFGGAYLAKPYSAKPESAVQESAKPYFAKPGNC